MIRYLTLIFLVFVLSCKTDLKEDGAKTADKPTVAVVNYPLYYFAKSIAGDQVEVYLPAIKGDPVYWKLDARQVNNFQKADLILANGAGYAKWMEKVSLPSSKILIASNDFKDKWIELEEEVTHSHGPGGEHVHRGTAYTTWLNFGFAIMQAEAIYNALKKLLPDETDELSSNFQNLKHELQNLDREMKTLALQMEEKYLLASHPVYQYLAQAYELNIISLHLESDEMPGDEQWQNLENIMYENRSNLMIWETQPPQEISQGLSDMGVGFVVFDPCGNRPETGNFLQVMRDNVNNLRNAMSL